MSLNESNLPINHTHSINAIRVHGIIGMIFALALYIGWFFHGEPNGPKVNQLFASIFGVLYLSGAMASAIAVRQMRVTGNGIGAAILFAVQIAGLFLAMGFDVLEYVAPQLRGSAIFFITDVAYPFSHVLMIIGLQHGKPASGVDGASFRHFYADSHCLYFSPQVRFSVVKTADGFLSAA
jgi:tryptophan-rich sensory protein